MDIFSSDWFLIKTKFLQKIRSIILPNFVAPHKEFSTKERNMCPTSLSWVLVIPSRYGRASSEEGEPIPMEHSQNRSDDCFYLFHIDTLVNLWFELHFSQSKWTNALQNTVWSGTTSLKVYKDNRGHATGSPNFQCASDVSGLLLKLLRISWTHSAIWCVFDLLYLLLRENNNYANSTLKNRWIHFHQTGF